MVDIPVKSKDYPFFTRRMRMQIAGGKHESVMLLPPVATFHLYDQSGYQRPERIRREMQLRRDMLEARDLIRQIPLLRERYVPVAGEMPAMSRVGPGIDRREMRRDYVHLGAVGRNPVNLVHKRGDISNMLDHVARVDDGVGV